MKSMKVVVLQEVRVDLKEGRLFYDSKEEGVGDYFFGSLISDLESLKFFAGIHSKRFGFYRMASKRFPFAIYYEIKNNTVRVIAVLDMRRNPAWLRVALETRKR